jgi:type II secretory pathway pseudopilin PulG
MMVRRPISRIRRIDKLKRIGFTLIDVTVTVLIIGIIGAVAVPRFGALLADYRAEAAARRVAGDLNYASRSALNQAQPVTATFVDGSQNYSFNVISHPDHPTAAWAIALNDAGYENCVFSGISLGGDQAVTFDIYGRPDSDGTITVRCGGSTQVISIDQATGRASVQ